MEGDMIDSRGTPDETCRLNARTRRTVVAQAILAAALAGWFLFLWSIPQSLPQSSGPAPDWLVLNLAMTVVAFLVIWRVLTGRTIEWTAAGGELRRRKWLSRPGSEPRAVMAPGPDAELVHETRYRWRVWPEGSAIDVMWPGQMRSFVGAVAGAGVRIDDFRGDWERGHPGLNAAAILAYGAGVVGLLATPIVGLLLGSGLPLLPIIAAAVAFGVGQAIDRGPYKTPKPAAPNS
jgi:hypothetical protein